MYTFAGCPVHTAGDLPAPAQTPPDHPEEEHRGPWLAGGRHLTQASLGITERDGLVIQNSEIFFVLLLFLLWQHSKCNQMSPTGARVFTQMHPI